MLLPAPGRLSALAEMVPTDQRLLRMPRGVRKIGFSFRFVAIGQPPHLHE